MLTSLSVDGFRSLRRFNLELKPGLNVLVGPNGAGKSNIIRFLEFLSFTHDSRLIESVSKSGGAGEIFFRTPSEEFSRDMKFTIRGGTVAEDDNDGEYFLEYEYAASIRIAKDFSSIYYPYQSISARFFDENEDVLDKKSEWDLQVESHVDDFEKIGFTVIKNSGRERFIDTDFESMTKNESFIRSSKEVTLTSIISYSVSALRYIRRDLSIGKVFNINPALAREPEDIAQSPFIESNGKGLASTLFALKQGDMARYMYGPYFPRQAGNRSKILEQIKSYVRLVNDNIIDIDVKYDTFDNKLKVFSTVKSEEAPIIIPLALLSDGTIKWLCLVSALVYGSSTFSLEEPENFLHPRMQIEFIEILRSLMHPNGNLKTVIISTHSETVLNALRPEEIVIVRMNLSQTEADRIQDPDTLADQIRDSGFGLGFYYLTGSL